MPKSRSRKFGRCLFCGQHGPLSKTHIWPDWLERLLPSPRQREEIETRTGRSPLREITVRRILRLGSLFSQKPYLACIHCNTGWMQKVEDQMLKFSKPIFISHDPITL